MLTTSIAKLQPKPNLAKYTCSYLYNYICSYQSCLGSSCFILWKGRTCEQVSSQATQFHRPRWLHGRRQTSSPQRRSAFCIQRPSRLVLTLTCSTNTSFVVLLGHRLLHTDTRTRAKYCLTAAPTLQNCSKMPWCCKGGCLNLTLAEQGWKRALVTNMLDLARRS